jgi:hypothetical protein
VAALGDEAILSSVARTTLDTYGAYVVNCGELVFEHVIGPAT